MPGVTAYDTFSRPDSASALGNTETGLAWTVSAGTTWGISGGKAYCPTLGSSSIWPGPGGHAVVDIVSADMVVEALITAMGSTASTCYGIVARYQDAQNCWVAFVINSAGTPLLYSGPVVAGAVTYSVANGVALSGSGPWLLKLAAKGDAVILFVNGAVKGAVASSTLDTQTKAGLMVGNAGATQALIENWGAMPYPDSRGSAITQQIMQDSPIVYWPMDEESGNFNDRSGNARPALVPTSVAMGSSPPAGPFSRAPHFTGSPSKAVSASSLDLSAYSSLTVVGWVCVDDTAGGMLWEHTNNSNTGTGTNPAGFYFFGENDPPLNWYSNLGPNWPVNNKYVVAPAPGVWHHITQIFDYSQNATAEVKLYLDGALQALTDNGTQFDHSSGTTFANAPFNVGWRADANILYAKFYLRHLAMFSGVLSAARIKTQYLTGTREGVSV